MPLSAVFGPRQTPPRLAIPGHSSPRPTSDAYRIPKHRTRCLELLSAHTKPRHAQPRHANPSQTTPGLTTPIHVKLSASVKPPFETEPLPLLTAQTLPDQARPRLASPRRFAPRLTVLPPHSRLSLSGYRLFTAIATSHPAAPGHVSPAPASPLKISYRSALDAMPVRALTFAIASMFARR